MPVAVPPVNRPMNVALIGTQTGRGHVAVLESLQRSFRARGIDAVAHPSFAEDMLPQNRFLSEFYNYLLSTSLELANAYVDFLVYSRNDKSDVYCAGAEPHIRELLASSRLDAIVSAAPFANYALARALERSDARIPWFIVVTDPFVPTMVGFECPGADRYFVATEAVKLHLVAGGVDAGRVDVTGYPVAPAVFERDEGRDAATAERYGLQPGRKVITCSAGAAGAPSFLAYLKAFLDAGRPEQLVFVAGRNRFLQESATRLAQGRAAGNVKVVGFVDDMPSLLRCSDLLLTKAGANSVFEALYAGVPVLIDGTAPFLFQEKGVEAFLRERQVGAVCRSPEELVSFLSTRLADERFVSEVGAWLDALRVSDPSARIVDLIVDKVSGGGVA